MAANNFAFVTSTHGRDFDRLALLRRSLQRFAPGVPHFIAVDSEDFPAFRQRFGDDPQITALLMSDLLPEKLESARRRSRFFHKLKPMWSFSYRVLPLGYFDGYLAQQLAKFELVRRSGADIAIVIDSDVVLTRPVDAQILQGLCCVADGRPRCLMTEITLTPQYQRSVANAVGLLKLPADCARQHYGAIFMQRMVEAIEAANAEPWMIAMARCKTYSEFYTYGTYCRFIEDRSRVALVEPTEEWTLNVWDTPSAEAFQQALDRAAAPTGPYFFNLQSIFKGFNYNEPLAAVRQLIERELDSAH
jgi:hypothetical protein